MQNFFVRRFRPSKATTKTKKFNCFSDASTLDEKSKRVNLLQKVQDRIANPRPDDNLESIFKLVQQTNCYAVDKDSIHFDLCLLDKQTVSKITKVLGISVK